MENSKKKTKNLKYATKLEESLGQYANFKLLKMRQKNKKTMQRTKKMRKIRPKLIINIKAVKKMYLKA